MRPQLAVERGMGYEQRASPIYSGPVMMLVLHRAPLMVTVVHGGPAMSR